MAGGAGVAFDVFRAVQAGYAVVIQDVRGRFASEGEFNPHCQEARDGADTIAWVAIQPWSSGIVGGSGGSYLGCTQWLAAREQPRALRAMSSAVAPSDMYEGMAYQGGANVFHGLRWAAAMTIEEIRRRAARGAATPEGGPSLELDAVLNRLPLAGHPLLNEYTPWYRDWLAHPTADAYWHPISPSAAYEKISAPTLHISGWYDIFLSAVFENYRGMRRRGGTERARQNQRLLVGPWSHSNFAGSFPEREFGPTGSSASLDLTGIHLRWFDRWLKDADNEVELEPPVMLFVMGIDRWRTEWATANVFLPGHRIRLEVSSSNFPRFGRNSNTGGEIVNEATAEYRPAINRIFHNASRASCLILPIIER